MSFSVTRNAVENIFIRTTPSVVGSNMKLAYTLHESHGVKISRSPEPPPCFSVSSVCSSSSRKRIVLLTFPLNHS